MKTGEARKLIGKPVRYRNLKGWNPERWEEGIIEQVIYKQICIQGNWFYLPYLVVVEVGS